MKINTRINLELKVAQIECYNDYGEIIYSELERFTELVRKYHFVGYDVLKYDLKIREMQNAKQQKDL